MTIGLAACWRRGAGPVDRSSTGIQASNTVASRLQVDLAAGQQRNLATVHTATIRLGILYAESSALELVPQRRLVDAASSVAITAATACPRSGSGTPSTYAVEPPADPGDRLLHFGRGDVGARGLDHRTAPAEEVVEPVRVGAHEIAGVKPAVGVEAFLAAALVVALHDVRPADAQLAVARRSWSRSPVPACRTTRAGARVGRFRRR